MIKQKIAKDKIHHACVQKQEEIISNFESRVAELKEDSTGLSYSASQSEDRTAGKIELLVSMERELAFAKMEMGFLQAINPDNEADVVEPGAVVVTDKRIFYIAISSEKVEVDGQKVFGLSTRAPIYTAMQGLKKGDTFSFNNIDYTITDLY